MSETPPRANTAPTIPVIVYPPELPVSQRRDDIARTIAENQVVIIAGATGSGKTTQIPKICLELGRESIAHTQPRRLAARTIAERVAEELGEEVGGLVGYQVRFTDKASANTRIKLMTDGILLNEMHRDRLLRRYDTIIIDEAHERSLNIDFLLGYLRQLLPQRPDLKVIITSATIDPASFARHFAAPALEEGGEPRPAPIIEVSGRTYPVEIRHRPLVAEAGADDDSDLGDDGATADDRDYLQGILDGLDELARESSGDVLVFLSGENEIRDAEEAVRAHYSSARSGAGVTEVLPLYGRLSSADQHRVFEPSKIAGVRRRIVLATNVAETSLTVPGIKYVIDAGTARISRYSVRSKVQRLPIEAISQASANQRSGRSGRTSDGIAIRLYSEEDFARRPEYTEPEILRTNLAAVILQMISLGLGDIAAFPFLTPPDSRGIKDGLDLLTELGALRAVRASTAKGGSQNTAAASNQEPHPQPEPNPHTPSNKRRSTTDSSPTIRLSRIGQQLAKLPIDPRFGRMVIEAKEQGVEREVLAIVAGLTIQDPRERPLERRQAADEKHARFADPTSDFLGLLNLWNYLEKQQRELGSSAFRRLCKNEFLNYLRVREWNDVYRQLRQLSKPLGLTIKDSTPGGEAAPNPDGIHRALLSGLLSHIGLKDAAQAAENQASRGRAASGARKGKGEYIGARQQRFTIFPGSALAKKQPDAVMAAELVETSRLFARTNAAIDPAWAEALAGDLCKRSYSEPHWSKSQGSVSAYEKVTLYGVPIVPKRRVQFSRIDPSYARELFIRHALVEGDWDVSNLNSGLLAFDRANKKLRAELQQLEERTRRRDILFDDEAVFEFYHRRIPADVSSTRSFESWWRKARTETPDLLSMTAEALVPDDAPDVDERLFPPSWRQDDQIFTLRYRFEPGAADDGVTVVIPLTLLARLRPEGFDWQVDGLRRDLITALIKSLPKVIRRTVVPAADWAAKIAAELPLRPDDRPFTEAVAAIIKKLAYVPVTAADFDLDRVPDHLRVTFQVVDGRGREVDSDKELRALQGRLSERARDAVAQSFARLSDAAPKLASTPLDSVDVPAASPAAIASAAANGASGAGVVSEQSGLTQFPLAEIPRFVDLKQAGNTIRAYPALVDEGQTVALRLLATAEEQARAMPGGIRRLLLLATPSPVAYIQKHLTSTEKLTLAASPYRGAQALFEDCLAACVDDVLFRVRPDGQILMRAEFETARDRVSGSVMDSLFDTVKLVASTLIAARNADRALKAASSINLMAPLADARQQLDGLVYPGFISTTGLERLRHFPRYLAGIIARIEKLTVNPGRDRVWLNEVQAATAAFAQAGGRIPLEPHSPPSLVKARWMLEELRISLFAQELRTAETVSLQRITKTLAS